MKDTISGEAYTTQKIERENLAMDADDDISNCLARPKAIMRSQQVILQLQEVYQ